MDTLVIYRSAAGRRPIPSRRPSLMDRKASGAHFDYRTLSLASLEYETAVTVMLNIDVILTRTLIITLLFLRESVIWCSENTYAEDQITYVKDRAYN